MTAILIDPPIGPYSGAAAIREWIRELEKLPQEEIEVQEALDQARRWLKFAEEKAA